MKRNEVEVGGTYLAKVGARNLEVRIEGENSKGGWNAVSVATGKPVRVKDARHLKPGKPATAPNKPAPEAQVATEADVRPAPADSGPVPATKPEKAKTRAARREPEATPEKATAEDAPQRLSCLDAAAAVLKAKGGPMQCKAMVEAMAAGGLWTTAAPTPAATLYSAIIREITKKGSASRFRKTERGHFALNG